MAQKTPKGAPPKYIASAVALLAPRAARIPLMLALSRNYTSVPNCIVQAAYGIGRATAIQSVHAFNPVRLFGDLCCLAIAFLAVPPPVLGVILLVALVVLTWRDGYIDPPESSGAEAATDAVVLATFIALTLTILYISGFRGLGMLGFGTGLCIGTTMISGWRFVFRMKKQPPLVPESSKTAQRVWALWIAGLQALSVSNLPLLPPTTAFLNVAMMMSPMLLFCIAYVSQSDAIGGVGSQAKQSMFGLEKAELTASKNRLYAPRTDAVRWFEPLLLLSLAFPMVWGGIRFMSGSTPPEQIQWAQLASNVAALAVLWSLWTAIKKIHRQAAIDIQKELDRLEPSKSAT